MTDALLTRADSRPDLASFFARLHECRDKTQHVHGLHPYPAKFIPHIPRALIAALAAPGDVVLDPMCGSGTTVVEAVSAGHLAFGVDLNPVATLVSRAKVMALSPEEQLALQRLAAVLQETATRLLRGDVVLAVQQAEPPEFHNRDKWFNQNVAQELAYAKEQIVASTSGAALGLALCAFSAITVAVSNQESETRWCAKPNPAPDGATLIRLTAKLADSAQRVKTFAALQRAEAEVYTADARDLPLAAESVGLVVTSPPYANSHDYYLYNKLRMFWLGEDVAQVQRGEIGSRNRHSDWKEEIQTYVEAMSRVMLECRRVMRDGSAMAIVVADAVIRGAFYDMSEIYDVLATATGFSRSEGYNFGHRQFNSSFQRGFGTKREKRTHVLIYRTA